MTDPVASITAQFAALAVSEGWKKKSDKYKQERRAYIAFAVNSGFLAKFGRNTADLLAWQSLCGTIGVGGGAEALRSIKACKKALAEVYVNIVDLVDAAQAGTKIRRTFGSSQALAAYIKRTKKIFPKEKAKSNPLLQRFLIVVY
ncbi:hypothetical protein FB107DRAFT_287570 [Schizophyllum commune]